VIIVDDLVKEFGNVRAVDKLSFRVESGELLGLVGPNGAGKTTTLRCMVGIIPPTSGHISLCGFDIRHNAVEARKRLAFVPDEPSLFDYLTVWDHIIIISRMYNINDGLLRGEKLLTEFDLIERRNAFPTELSRGMKQKLVIALALLHRPEVLILDEPLTGLDPSAMRAMKQTITRTASQGVSVIVSSHMLHLVEEICSTILIIQSGKKVVTGSLAEIRKILPDLSETADLEDIFMKATKKDNPPTSSEN